MALTQEDLQQIVDAVNQTKGTDVPDLPSFRESSFYTTWSSAFSSLGLSGVIAIPNTSFDEWLFWFQEWAKVFTKNYNDFKNLVNQTFIELNQDIATINDDILQLKANDEDIYDKIAGVSPKQINYLQDVKFEERIDSVTSTPYTIIRIPHIDNNGDVIKLKNGFANDVFSATNKETPSSFRKRHKQATVIINGAPWNTNNGAIMGKFIQDGVILNSGGSTGKETLGITKEGKLQHYVTSATIDDVVAGGAYNAIGGFFPLIVDGKEYDYTSVYENTYPNMNGEKPRQVIAQFKNLDIIIFTFDGRTYTYGGVTLEDATRIAMSFGVDFAYNLDGGGSNATLVNGVMLNPPTDNDYVEREVPNFLYFEKENKDYLDITDDNELMSLSKKTTATFRKLFFDLLDKNGNFKPPLPQQIDIKDFNTIANNVSKYRGTWINTITDITNAPPLSKRGHYIIIDVIPFNETNALIRVTRYGDQNIWINNVTNGVLGSWSNQTSILSPATFTNLNDVAKDMLSFSGYWYTSTTDIIGAPIDSVSGHNSLIEITALNTTNGTIKLTRYGDNIVYFATVLNGVIQIWKTLNDESLSVPFNSFTTVASNIGKYSGKWKTAGNDISGSPSGSQNGHYSLIEINAFNDNSGIIKLTRFADNLIWQAGVNNGTMTSWKQIL